MFCQKDFSSPFLFVEQIEFNHLLPFIHLFSFSPCWVLLGTKFIQSSYELASDSRLIPFLLCIGLCHNNLILDKDNEMIFRRFFYFMHNWVDPFTFSRSHSLDKALHKNLFFWATSFHLSRLSFLFFFLKDFCKSLIEHESIVRTSSCVIFYSCYFVHMWTLRYSIIQKHDEECVRCKSATFRNFLFFISAPEPSIEFHVEKRLLNWIKYMEKEASYSE